MGRVLPPAPASGNIPRRIRAASSALAARTSLSAGLLVVNRESRLLGRHGKATFDALRHPRHQYLVAEAFPALLGVVNCDDRPAIRRRPGRVEDLTFGQAAVARMHGRDRRLVLLLRRSRKLVDNAIGHARAPFARYSTNPARQLSQARALRERLS